MTKQERLAEIAKTTAGIFFDRILPDECLELRLLKVPHSKGGTITMVGHFTDPKLLAEAALLYTQKGGNAYITLNPSPIEKAEPRGLNVCSRGSGSTTDAEITRRRVLIIDLDPATEKTGVAATEEEKNKARLLADQIGNELTSDHGWPMPVVCDSGNGLHLLYAIDFLNTPEVATVQQNFLLAAAERWGSSAVKVDRTMFNASRITRLYGTLNRKGPGTPERPHRYSKILFYPEDFGRKTVTLEQLEAFTAQFGAKPKQAKPSSSLGGTIQSEFRLEDFVARHFPEAKVVAWNGGTKWQIDCPWNPSEHRSPDAFISQASDGKIGAKCSHDSCSWTWHELRDRFEPRQQRERLQHHGFDDEEAAEEQLLPKAERLEVTPKGIKFPLDVFPQEVIEIVDSVTKLTGSSYWWPALSILGICSACHSSKVEMKQLCGRKASANLYLMGVGRPGSGKSSNLTEFLQLPLNEANNRLEDEFSRAEKEAEVRHQANRLLLRDLSDELKRAKDAHDDRAKAQLKGPKDGEPEEEPKEEPTPKKKVQPTSAPQHRSQDQIKSEIAQVQAELDNKTRQENLKVVHKAKSVTTSNPTPEALYASLLRNDETMMVLNPEGSGWIKTMNGRYAHGQANWGLVNKAYSGEPDDSDRVGTNNKRMRSPYLTILLGIHEETFTTKLGGDFLMEGTASRFDYYQPPYSGLTGLREPFTFRDESQRDRMLARWKGLVAGWLSLPKREHPGAEVPLVRLSEKAGVAMKAALNGEILEMSKDEVLTGYHEAYGARMAERFGRYCLVLHCIWNSVENPGDLPWERPVSEETVLRAVALTRFFFEQYRQLWGSISTDGKEVLPSDDRLLFLCEEILRHIPEDSDGKTHTVAVRDIYRCIGNKFGQRKNAAMVRTDMEELARTGWVSPKITKYDPKGGRPSNFYEVDSQFRSRTEESLAAAREVTKNDRA